MTTPAERRRERERQRTENERKRERARTKTQRERDKNKEQAAVLGGGAGGASGTGGGAHVSVDVGGRTNIGEGGEVELAEHAVTFQVSPAGPNIHARKLDIPLDYRPGWLHEIAFKSGSPIPGTMSGQLCMWADDAEGGAIVYQSPGQVWGFGSAWRRAFPTPASAPKLYNGKSYWVGIFTNLLNYRYLTMDPEGGESRALLRLSTVPQSFTGFGLEQGTLAADFFYVSNADPSKPFISSPSPGQQVNESQPLISMTTPHNNGDISYDFTKTVHLQIWRQDAPGVMIVDQSFEPLEWMRASKVFEIRSPAVLPTGTNLQLRARHQDSFEYYSIWSDTITFICARGPKAPTLTGPGIGTPTKLNAISGYNITGVYEHELNLASNRVQIDLMNSAGNQVLYSLDQAIVLSNGQSFSVAEWHPDLLWGTAYQYRVRFRSRNEFNTGDVWGPYSNRLFRTNSAPFAPQNMFPAASVQTGAGTLTAHVTDPDGDPVTAGQVELYNITNNVAVTLTNSVIMTDDLLSINAAPNMTYDKVYRWRARASDGILYGNWTDWQTFTYRAAPIISFMLPTITGQRNMIEDPSFEHGLVSTFWTAFNEVANVDYAEQFIDGDAAYGSSGWRFTESATSAHYLLSRSKPLDTTIPLIAFTHAKRESGVSRSSFAVEFLNAGGSVIGTVYPSILGAMQVADVPTTWTAYGGVVWPIASANTPKMPAGAVQWRIRVTPSAASEAVVRFDGYYADQMPLMSLADMLDATKWFGYFDGDVRGFDESPGAPGYAWTGPVGDSESVSQGVHVARDGNLSLWITYGHPTLGAGSKAGDRVTIERATEEGWEVTYQAVAFAGGSRLKIPLPFEVMRNENRYRLTVEVIDTVGITSHTPYVYTDTRFEGPKELNILVARVDNDRAQVHLVFEQTGLGLTQFGGVEIARGPAKTIVDRVDDPSVTEWVDRAALSGVTEDYWVRQVELRGGDTVESRWDHAVVTPEYLDFWLKDVEETTTNLRLNILSGDEPSTTYAAPQTSFRPWGDPKPVHILSEERSASGTLVLRVLEDPDAIMDPILVPVQRIQERRRVCILLTQRPARRRYVTVTEMTETAKHIPWYSVWEMGWEESNYAEDFYEREGEDIGF